MNTAIQDYYKSERRFVRAILVVGVALFISGVGLACQPTAFLMGAGCAAVIVAIFIVVMSSSYLSSLKSRSGAPKGKGCLDASFVQQEQAWIRGSVRAFRIAIGFELTLALSGALAALYGARTDAPAVCGAGAGLAVLLTLTTIADAWMSRRAKGYLRALGAYPLAAD